MIVEPRFIFKRLSRTCSNAFNAAAGQCLNAHLYEITTEHGLLALLDDAESDVAALVTHYQIDPARLRKALQRSIEDLRAGSSGRPQLSPRMLDWLQDSWTVGSIDHSYTKIRSGVLFLMLLQRPTQYYASSGVGSCFDAIPRDDLKANLAKIIAGSKEEAESQAEAVGAAAGPDGKPTAGEGGPAEGSALARFCVDFTGRARKGQIDPVFGREREIRQMVDILARRRKNNPIIVGDAGVGKTALVEGLALLIVQNQVPPLLSGVEIMGLDLGLLQAGAGVKGEFENRLKQVISEVKGSPRPIVLFIDEAHTIIGAGGPQGGGDAANLLKPALARGELRTIAATTWSEFKKYFEKDAALERRFQPVRVDEPSEAVAVTMLRGLRPKFEEAHQVIITDAAVTAAVRLSARYISGRKLPDKAVDLLDTCAARVKVALQQTPAAVEDGEVLIRDLTRELDSLARDKDAGVRVDEERRAELTHRLEKAREDLATVTAAYTKETDGTRRVIEARKKMATAKAQEERDAAREEVIAALNALTESQGEVPLIRPDVDEAMVATVVAAWTGIPVGQMVQDDVKAMLEIEGRLTRRIKGQSFGLSTIAKELRSARAGLKPLNTPQGVFLLVGPSGVGKTETALGLADLLFGGERMMTVINMSEFQEKHTVSRLIGSPPGYVGYGEGGVLTEAVRQRPYTVVLLDEVEKADPDVMNLFYQVFDKGMLADGEGRLVDFKNTVMVLTSNLATDRITNMTLAARGEDSKRRLDEDPVFMREVVEAIKPTLTAHFKPALLARMTVVPYLPISPDALAEVTRLKLSALLDRLRNSQRIEGTYTEELVERIARRCTEVDTGARNIDHILRATLLPQLSVAVLEKMAEGPLPKRLELGVDGEGQFTITWGE